MSVLINRISKARWQAVIAILALCALVIGLPFIQLTPEAEASNPTLQSTFSANFPGYPDGQTPGAGDSFNYYSDGSGDVNFELEPVGPVPTGTPTIEVNGAANADATVTLAPDGTVSVSVDNAASHLNSEGKLDITITYPNGSCWHGQITVTEITEWTVSQPLDATFGNGSTGTIDGNSYPESVVFPLIPSEGGNFKMTAQYDLTDGGAGNGTDDYQLMLSGLPDQEPLMAPAGTTNHTFEFTIPSYALSSYQLSLSLVNASTGEVICRTPLTTGGYRTTTTWGSPSYDFTTDSPFKYPEKCAPCSETQTATETDEHLPKGEGSLCAEGVTKTESDSDNTIKVSTAAGADAAGSGGASLQNRANDIGGSAAGGGSLPVSQDPARPESLQVAASESVEITMDSSNSYPAEIVTASGTTKVEDVVSNGYTINYYDKDSTTPDTCLLVTRPTTLEADGSQALRFIEARFGGTLVETKYTQKKAADGSEVWFIYQGAELDSKTDVAPEADFLRKTQIEISAEVNSERTRTVTVEERRADSNAWQIISKIEKTYRNYIWGNPIIKEVRDPGGRNLTCSWTYYSEASDGLKVGLIKSYQHHTGDWTEYEWDSRGRLSKVREPFLDAAPGAADNLCEVWEITYGSEALASRRETASIKGVAISENYISGTFASRSFTRVATIGGTTGLTTTINRSPVIPLVGNSDYLYAANSYQVESITYPDGTKHSCTWAYSGSDRIQTCKSGNAALTRGSKSVKTTDLRGNLRSVESYALDFNNSPSNEQLLKTVAYDNLDGLSRPTTTTITFADGSPTQSSSLVYGCCGLNQSTDIRGIVTDYHNDHLKRVETRTSLGVTYGTQYNGLERKSVRIPEANALTDAHGHITVRGTLPAQTIVQGQGAYNIAREMVTRSAPSPQHTDGTTLVDTTYSYSYGAGTTITVNYPDGGQSISDSHRDGRTASTTGSAVNDMSYEYGPSLTGVTASNGAVFGSKSIAANGTQWTASMVNFLGQSVLTYFADGATATRHYNTKGQLERSEDPDAVTSLYAYNDEGQRTTSALDLNDNDSIDEASDRITFSEGNYGVTKTGGFYGHETLSKIYDAGDSSLADAFTTSVSQSSIDGLRSWNVPLNDLDLLSTSVTVLNGGGNWTATSVNATGLTSVSTYQAGLLQTQVNQETDSDPVNEITRKTYTYDEHNRVSSVDDSRTGVTSVTFYNNDQTKATTLERATGTTDDLVNAYTYDELGRTLTVDAPNTAAATNITHTSYDFRGLVTATWGDQTYARYYKYNSRGQMEELRTYQDLAHGTEPTDTTTGFASTTWLYDSERGWLDGKRDAATQGADYTYSDAGRLETRTWARTHPGESAPLKTTYDYTNLGELESVTYDHDANLTPDLDYQYDRLGRLERVDRDGVLHAEYDFSETNLRLTDEHLNKDLPVISATLTRDYDDFLRLERTSIAHPASPTPFYGSTYGYDAVGRLGSVTNDRSGDLFTYGYQDQSFGLVRSVTGPVHTVTNDWEAHRNILDKKTNGPVTAPISSYHYTVNDLGQRTNLATDGSAFSVQPALTWTYNARGELVETADASASDFDRAYQYDGIGNREKTAQGLLADLPASANYQADVLNQYSSVTLGSTALSPVHDLDGNATSYPLPADGSANSTLVWDGENRLVSATTPNNEVTTFTYDYLSRRMTKATTTGATTATECYLYDGWNPIVEKRAPTGSSFDEIRLYTWGTDLSGSSQGAGGVAGLLAIEKQGNIFSSSPTTDHYYPTYDGNGNVSEYLDSASLVVAHFEYDPFGNTTVNTDTAGLFDILFSTKKRDLATGLYYYGYRYYDPKTGRWPSRDPIGELGGINVYGMIGNDLIADVDFLGLTSVTHGNEKDVRIDSESAIEGAEDGDVHIHDKKDSNKKYHYNTKTCKFEDDKGNELPKRIKKIIKKSGRLQRALDNAMERVGKTGGFAPKHGGGMGRAGILGVIFIVFSTVDADAKIENLIKAIEEGNRVKAKRIADDISFNHIPAIIGTLEQVKFNLEINKAIDEALSKK